MSEVFHSLFEGFPYAQGTDAGGCAWVGVTSETIEMHLDGKTMIGIYPMVYDPEKKHHGTAGFISDDSNRPIYPDMRQDLWKCKWGAIDIDEGDDSVVYGQNAATILQALDIQAWVELSRSKGCHVWVFAQDWVEAPIMRQALLAAVQLSKIEFDAVYPKQDYLEGPPGNYMRLPYGGKRPEGRQEVLDSEGYPMELYDFLLEASTSLTPVSALKLAAALWQPPVKNLPPERSYNRTPLMQMDGTRLRGVARRMWEDGPHQHYNTEGAGRGRHGFLGRFARAMWEAGYAQSDIMAWTSKLDAQLGAWFSDGPKFQGRPDAQRQIENVVNKARERATVR